MQELNIANCSLTQLYRSHAHPSVTATVSPVQRSNNVLTSTAGPPGIDNNCDKITLAPCSPNHMREHEEAHLQGNKETTQSMVCV